MAKFKQVNVVYSDRFLDHDTGGSDHPESPERLRRILKNLNHGPLGDSLKLTEPSRASNESVLDVHSSDYLLRFEEACLSGRQDFGHPDNRICYDTYNVALLAAGACMNAVDLSEKAVDEVIFALVRPPGHHAETSLPLGFCFLNNVAIAARYWQKKYGRRRIFILDFDAHHGNGIQELFDTDPDVFYASIHEHPTFSFPGTGYEEDTGTGPGEGFTLNIALPPGATDSHVLKALKERVEPALEQFRPDCIVSAAGFDAHEADDMSGLAYTTPVFGHIGSFLAMWAERMCQGRLISVLEGGYSLDFLGPSVEMYLGALALKI